jgi:hypothetical protein
MMIKLKELCIESFEKKVIGQKENLCFYDIMREKCGYKN